MLSVSPSTQETRLATPPRKIERWKGDAIVARVQSVHSFLFLFFHPPTFPPLSECESGSNVDPRDASSPSPPSFKCAFFFFSFFFYVDKAENGNRGPLSPTTLDEICCFVDVANNRRKKFFSGASFIPTD